MNTLLKLLLSMSFSGGLLILALLLAQRLWRDKISRRWQYYIWLVVLLRLLLPFGAEVSLLGQVYQSLDQAVTQTTLLPRQQIFVDVTAGVYAAGNKEDTPDPVESRPLPDLAAPLAGNLWLIWLAVALGLLLRKLTLYQSFVRYIKAGAVPVSDTAMLDRLAVIAEQAGIKRPVELCVAPPVASPLLIGFFRPCIVLPGADIPEQDFRYIVLHELTHYKRRDMFYKWLVQVTVCLHWFNPLVYLMSREIGKACEFACDEAVLAKAGRGCAQAYGRTLLDAMAAVGRYRANPGAVTLSENKQLLKERLEAIMKFKEQTGAVKILAVFLTLCVVLSAAFIGVYPAAAAAYPKETAGNQAEPFSIESCYEAESLPLFEIAFARLDENAQQKWLEKLYADGDFAFFSVAVRGLDEKSPLRAGFAEKAYKDEDMAIFSTLTDCMDKAELELWLNRALQDGSWAFQSILYDKLNRNGEFDEREAKQEKEWAEAQLAAYRAVGVTMDGKDYYYAGQLVNIFLDMRADRSFCTLNMNPKGTVNIKIVRDADNKITGVAYLTDAEAADFLY